MAEDEGGEDDEPLDLDPPMLEREGRGGGAAEAVE